jgi:hypothetical protein
MHEAEGMYKPRWSVRSSRMVSDDGQTQRASDPCLLHGR